jgi:hypothetical protein
MKTVPNYAVTPLRVVLGICTGALLGAAIVAGNYIWGPSETEWIDYVLEYDIPAGTHFHVAPVLSKPSG